MPTARKTKSGNWRCQAFDRVEIINGKKKYFHKSFTARTKHEAERLAVQWMQNKNRPSSELTLSEAIDKYIEIKQNVLSPTTLHGYRSLQRNAYGNLLGMRIDQIGSEHVQSTLNAYAVAHSAKSCRNALGLLTAVITAFIPDASIHATLPQKKRIDYYTPSDEDIQRLVQAIKYRPLYLAVLLAAFGTLRRSEVCGLMDTDISGCVVRVRRARVETENGWQYKDYPKNDSSNRDIVYPQFVIDELTQEKGALVKMTPKRLDINFARARNRAGLPYFRFHDLRSYSVSIAHALNIPDAYLMERGGWSNPDTYRSVYRRVIDDENREITAQLNAHFEKLHSKLHFSDNKKG